MEQAVFYLFAAVSVVAALLVVFQRKAVYCALALIVCFFAVAVLFYQLGALFISAIQVIVYAGAIMVLFVFVIMLIDPDSDTFRIQRTRSLVPVALPLALVFGWVLLEVVGGTSVRPAAVPLEGEIAQVATSLFSEYLLPFELTSILILTAVLGAIVLAKRAD